MEGLLRAILEQVQREPLSPASPDSQESWVVDGKTHRDLDIMRVCASTPYAFGLKVLDMLFSKNELRGSLLFGSKKSNKPGLDGDRVAKLLAFVENKWGSTAYDFDVKKFAIKVNQKCRDAQLQHTTASQSAVTPSTAVRAGDPPAAGAEDSGSDE